ncbi:hypothetical protein DL96DRAFT_1574251 [Flagelloscypha sp. PMI_526]|nr:hypothetical protein DL96DRAFT_1574251 [Flagelloscypha sp. PMI_526]
MSSPPPAAGEAYEGNDAPAEMAVGDEPVVHGGASPRGSVLGETDKSDATAAANGKGHAPPTSINGTEGSESGTSTVREKQIKFTSGGLPEHTREEDLQNCFGQLGGIEFDTREAAVQSVNKYNEGYFMGNKIKVELSHGGGRTAKYMGEPGSCFKCGSQGHWARECPHHGPGPVSALNRRPPPEPSDRMDREPYRDPRDYRRFSPPPRDYGPPPRIRDYDDYRRPPPPIDRYGVPPPSRYGPPPPDFYRYGPPPPLPPLPPGPYDRYDRRAPPPPGYLPPHRMRSPPRMSDYDRGPPPMRYIVPLPT